MKNNRFYQSIPMVGAFVLANFLLVSCDDEKSKKEFDGIPDKVALSTGASEKKEGEEGKSTEAAPEEPAAALPPQQTSIMQGDQLVSLGSPVGQMAQVVQMYFAAPTYKDQQAYIYNAKRVAPLMEEYYKTHEYKPKQVASMDNPSGFGYRGVAFWRTKVQFEDETTAFVAMTFVGNRVEIDWESQVRYCSQDWDAWIQGEPDQMPEGDFRVYAQLDGTYIGPYANQDKYVSLFVTIMGSARSIIVYADKEDYEQMALVQQIAQSQGQITECTLRLKRVNVPGSPKPVAVLEKVLSTCWIIVPSDLD